MKAKKTSEVEKFYQNQEKKTSQKPESSLEQLKREIDLAALVEAKGIKLKRLGKNLVGRCPFHDDKTASLSISNNLFHCFGCNEGGSVVDWVMKTENVNLRKAIELLRGQAPVLSTPSPKHLATKTSSSPQREISSEDQAALREVIDHYHQTLKNTPKALDYLAKRGIKDKELIEKFKIGFADRTLSTYLSKKGKKGKELRQSLIKVGIFRTSGHEHFRGSLVIPIMDKEGNITEIYGRKINNNLRSGTAYHLYLPGPHRGIFNPECLSKKEVILCESLIDALSFWVNGFTNVTASYGAQGFTEEYLSAFKANKIERVYIAYDSDQAGNKATTGLVKKLSSSGIESYRIEFPNGFDANEFVCQSKNAKADLSSLLEKAKQIGKVHSPINKASHEIVAEIFTPQQKKKPKKEEETAKEKNIEIPSEYQVTPKVEGENIEITIEDRRYRIRGFYKNTSFDSLRINVRVFIGTSFHVDTLELLNARQRFAFIKTTAQELGINVDIIKRDVGRILLGLEELQKEYIEETLEPKVKEVILSEEEKREALVLLKSPKLTQRIVEDYALCGLVGEKTNILVCYLALVSRKLKDPLAVIVQALSSSGKSMLMNTALSFVPEEDVVKYTAMTGQSLFYMGETNLVHKTLAICEEEGADKASYPIKVMQSEKSLCIASTGKDPKSGRFTTHEYKVQGPTQIFMTTTSEEIEEEFQNRCLVLTTVANSSQTKAIHERQREQETLQGMLEQEDKEKITDLHQNAQRLLRPMMVVNPYAKQLTFLDSHLRTRRDHVKYLTLMRTIAFLHQYQRVVKRIKHQEEIIEYIEVTPQDIETANKIVNEIMGNCLGELAPQTKKFLQLITQMVQERMKAEQVSQDKCLFTRKQVRDYTSWSNTQVKLHLDRLVDLEYVLARSGSNGLRYEYRLLYSGEGKDETPFVMGLIDTSKLYSKRQTDSHNAKSEYDGNLSG